MKAKQTLECVERWRHWKVPIRQSLKDEDEREDPDCLATATVSSVQSNPNHRAYMRANLHVSIEKWYHGFRELYGALRYMSYASGVDFVVAHGSLIGWAFQKCMLPYDDDGDFQIVGNLQIQKYEAWLATLRTSTGPPENKEYSADQHWLSLCIPDRGIPGCSNFTVYVDLGRDSHIESRLLYLPTGVYVDITYLYESCDYLHSKTKFNPLMMTLKTKILSTTRTKQLTHTYNTMDIWPLKTCRFCGFEFSCPHNVNQVLNQEYSKWSNTRYKDFTFDGTCWRNSLNS